MSRRASTRTTEHAEAICQACEWRSTGGGALGNAARHYDTTSHPVRTRIVNVIVYGTEADLNRAREANGQETMPL